MSDRLSRRAAAALLCLAIFAVLRLMWGGQQPPGKRYPASSYPGFDHEAHVREHIFEIPSGPACVDDDFWFTIGILDDSGETSTTGVSSTNPR